eukprot:CAMPEP_0170507992 /NCGR_PEP_ID=MMETSP0208-20121228/60841_1 /TAXON_ID=197538 /ORGANISM="Strombidium inclinatum, Strain S3" /LENGTH=77 /DNA_ID=CAMNT_0010790587 /DNA_START=573 /DNA_END=803 /DNA_ORIENTATION=+
MEENRYSAPFENIRHYAGVHFRLVKEDFLSGMRAGLEAYKEGRELQFMKIKVHSDFKFEDVKGVKERRRFFFSSGKW